MLIYYTTFKYVVKVIMNDCCIYIYIPKMRTYVKKVC